MRYGLFACGVLLILVALVTLLTLGHDPLQAWKQLSALTLEQQFAICLGGLVAIWLIGSAILQAEKLSRQGKAIKQLQDRLDGVREATLQAADAQRDADEVVRVLAGSDPEEAFASLQKRLSEAERLATEQHSRNEGVDMLERVEEIRKRQKSLRQQIGEVLEKRRANEPIFAELKERQVQLDQALADVESDDRDRNVAHRLNETGEFVAKSQERLNAIQELLVTLSKLNDEITRCQAGLVPLQHSESGIGALLGQVHGLQYRLGKDLDRLELDGDEKLVARVEMLAKSKAEAERRIAEINDCAATAETICKEYVALQDLQANLERSLAQAETDESGRSLLDRLDECSQFAVQARARFEDLDKSLVVLNAIKEELVHRSGALAPLRDAQGGIAAVLGETRALRDRLARILDELEFDGPETLAARVDGLARDRREAERRIAMLTDTFAELGAIRNEVGTLFERLNSALDAHGGSRLPAR